MSLNIICDECFTVYQVSEDLEGRTMRCKQCGAQIEVYEHEYDEDLPDVPLGLLAASAPPDVPSFPPAASLPDVAAKPARRRSIVLAGRASGAVFYVLAFIALSAAGCEGYLGAASESWPTAEGQIIDCRREFKPDFGAGMPAPTYRVVFSYQYAVDGETYHSDSVAHSLFSNAGIVENYYEGERVAVHYDPGRPENCVIEPGISWMTVIFYLTLAALSGLLGTILYFLP